MPPPGPTWNNLLADGCAAGWRIRRFRYDKIYLRWIEINKGIYKLYNRMTKSDWELARRIRRGGVWSVYDETIEAYVFSRDGTHTPLGKRKRSNSSNRRSLSSETVNESREYRRRSTVDSIGMA